MPTPTKSGSTFNGWSTSSSGTSGITGSYSPSSDSTLYATWLQSTYSLSYNANGGSGAPTDESGSNSYTISSQIPERFGYTFMGWAKSSSAAYGYYWPGESIDISTNTTLYAVWSRSAAISTNVEYTASISYSYREVWYTFTPSSSGTYNIESSSSSDSRVYVYDSSESLLGNDDDGGEGRNFKLSVYLNANTKYYIKINCYSSGTGDICFNISGNTSVPTGSMSSTNNFAEEQTVTILLSDNDVGVAGYYWGTSENYLENRYISVSGGMSCSVTQTVSEAGNYYLTVKNISGIVSQTYTIKFCEIIFGSEDNTSYRLKVITKYGNSFTFPERPSMGVCYYFEGWGASDKDTGIVCFYWPGEQYTVESDEVFTAFWLEEHEEESVIIKAATCTKEGTKNIKCSFCGKVMKVSKIKATGHKYKTSVDTKATTSKDGKQTKKCTYCKKNNLNDI